MDKEKTFCDFRFVLRRAAADSEERGNSEFLIVESLRYEVKKV